MLIDVPPAAIGASTMQTREPSGSRPSRIGSFSSIVLPTYWAMLFAAASTAASSSNPVSTCSIRPARSTKTSRGPLTMTSVTVSSRKSGTMGPRKNSTPA